VEASFTDGGLSGIAMSSPARDMGKCGLVLSAVSGIARSTRWSTGENVLMRNVLLFAVVYLLIVVFGKRRER
jgi:hypothetical protein